MKLEQACALVRKWQDWPGLDQGDNPVPMDAIDALLEHAAPSVLAESTSNDCLLVAEGWQDIASAPKDGTPILITRPTVFPEEEAHVVFWADDWWQVHDGKFDHPLRGRDPSHWHPVPAPPAVTDLSGVGVG